MKFTLSWLKTHLETDASVDDIAAKLTAIGLEVEAVRRPGDELAAFTVAHVIEARQHPNADKLSLCVVDTGRSQVEVVCGAPNARTGMKGVFAPPGTTIPGTGVVLKKAKIRGVESCGMLCSEREMGLSDEHEGIIELDADAPGGRALREVHGPGRPAVRHRDHAQPRRLPRRLRHRPRPRGGRPRPPEDRRDRARRRLAFKSPIDVILDFPGEGPSPCPLFLGRYVRGVQNCESPRWLKDRLASVGLRPISALVDLTNFLTIDRNRPVHVFDAGKVKGDIWLRLGEGGARFAALNGKDYVLDDAMTAIGDESGVISLAGVMGGEPTGCTMETTDVFIEIALFDPVRTAATGRTFNLESDARYRFERGVDPAFAGPGMELMTRLVMELCGGEASEVVVAGAGPSGGARSPFRPFRVKALGGVDCERAESLGILTALGFACEEKDADLVAVEPPPWRGDIVGEADLVEEVLRIAGFDQIPAVSLSPTARERARPALSPTRRRLGAMRRALTARGMFEAVTWSFMPRQHAALFGDAPDALVLANPINAELDAMRPSILPNLIEACRRNADRGFADAALFETGPVYAGTKPEDQRTHVTGVRAAGGGAPQLARRGAAGGPLRRQGRCPCRPRRGGRFPRQPPDQGGGACVVPPRPGRHARARTHGAWPISASCIPACSPNSGPRGRWWASRRWWTPCPAPRPRRRARSRRSRPRTTRRPSATSPSSSTTRSRPPRSSAPPAMPRRR